LQISFSISIPAKTQFQLTISEPSQADPRSFLNKKKLTIYPQFFSPNFHLNNNYILKYFSLKKTVSKIISFYILLAKKNFKRKQWGLLWWRRYQVSFQTGFWRKLNKIEHF